MLNECSCDRKRDRIYPINYKANTTISMEMTSFACYKHILAKPIETSKCPFGIFTLIIIIIFAVDMNATFEKGK